MRNILWLLVCLPVLVQAQFQVSGTVVDSLTQEPLVGANIWFVDTKVGTVTGAEGAFSVNTDASYLEVSHVGYSSKRISIQSDTTLYIRLQENITGQAISTPIIITASSIIPNATTPVFEILPEQLTYENPISIAPALNRVPGVYMHQGALNTNRISIRGIGSRSPFATTKIRAYLDEIPLTSGIGETSLEDLDLSLIQKATVWKGPTAANYGAGLGGMIHLHPPDPTDLESQISHSFTAGSYGLFRNATQLNWTDNQQKVGLVANYNRVDSEGYRDNNRYDRQAFNMLGKVKLNADNETSWLINFTDLKAFIPSSLDSATFADRPRSAAANWASVQGFEDAQQSRVGLSHKHFFRTRWAAVFYNTISLFGGHRNAYESRPFNILEEKSRFWGGRSQWVWKGLEHYEVNGGLEFFDERYDWQTFRTMGGVQGELLSDQLEKRRYGNFFLSAAYEWPRVKVRSGFNANLTGYQLSDDFATGGMNRSGDYRFPFIFSPNLGINFEHHINHHWFASISHGFSAPTLEETLTPDGQLNPDIRPERGWNFETGVRGDFAYRTFVYELSVYQMNVTDLLVARRVGPDQFVGVNAGETVHRGLELFLSWLKNFNQHSLQINTTYTLARFKFNDYQFLEEEFDGNYLPGVPDHLLNGWVDWTFKNWYAHLQYQWVGQRYLDDQNSGQADSYQLLHSKLGYRTNLPGRLNAHFFAGIQNILDKKYAAMLQINAGSFGGRAPRYFYPGLPRNVYAGIELKYRL